MSILKIKNLNVTFPSPGGNVHAVRDASFEVGEGETFGLIGESGSGKSVIGLSILKLLPYNAIITGAICFKGIDIQGLSGEEMRKIRGRQISLMPQNPASSLNPVLKNGLQVSEVYEMLGAPRKDRLAKSIGMMDRLLLKDPQRISRSYPHQLSGGMKQRLLASIALSFRPELMLADEPTKGLDPEARQRSIELFRQIKREHGRSMLLITHDLDLAREVCDRIGVMYSGEIVEIGPAGKIVGAPSHPYTKGLVAALPRNGLVPLEGQSPSRINLPQGCLFNERCNLIRDECAKKCPPMAEHNGGMVKCHQFS